MMDDDISDNSHFTGSFEDRSYKVNHRLSWSLLSQELVLASLPGAVLVQVVTTGACNNQAFEECLLCSFSSISTNLVVPIFFVES